MARLFKMTMALAFAAGFCGGLSLAQQRSTVPSAGRSLSEYEVKAAFLLNFARFVEWPAFPPGQPSEPFSICIVGDDPFQGALDRVTEGEGINGRPILVRRVSRWQDYCQILFVASSERDAFRTVRQAGRGVLIVGEEPGFLGVGGMINFVVEDKKVRFEVSLKNAMEGAVKISSRLLSVARNVER
jgi:hypothetical protein